jgi:hypothetical protein
VRASGWRRGGPDDDDPLAWVDTQPQDGGDEVERRDTEQRRLPRAPKRSANHPLGTSKRAYASVKALKTSPISPSERPSSARIAGAAVEMQTRSR